MSDPMTNPIGCNTLYPKGRLMQVRTEFTLDAQCQAVQDLAAVGFVCLEYSHIEYLTLEEVERLRKATADAKIEPHSAHSWVGLPADQSESERTLTALAPMLDKCAVLGVKVIVIHPGGHMLSHEGAAAHSRRMSGNLSVLRPLCERAAKINLSVAVENCGPLEDLEFILELVRVSGARNAGFCIDTGHAKLFGISPAEAIMRMGKKLLTTHLQDNFGRRDDHMPPGTGIIDWVAVFTALRQIGYVRPVMVEISDCPPNREPEPQREMRIAYENVKKFMASVGEGT
jgi:sugar phosphate isomerase/epimerase